MTRHESYRPVRSFWIDEVPTHWRTIRNKQVLFHHKEIVGDKWGSFVLLTMGKSGVKPRDLDAGGKFPESFDTYQKVKPNQLIFCLFDLDETPRTVGLSSRDGMITSAYDVFSLTEDNDPQYWTYFYQAIDDCKGLRPYYSGLRKVVRSDTFMSIEVYSPPLNEQKLISQYLDKKTAQIDSIIEKIKKKIELLKEQRTSLINQYVTKGLDPNVEMKDSGVEWIGKIPKHWRLSKIKWVTSKIGSGITPRGGSEVYSETGVPFLRSQNIHFDGLRLEDVVYISDEIDESMSGSRVQRNDILFNITGGSIGRCCLVRSDARMNVNQHVCIVRPNSEIFPEFLLTVLSSELGQSQLHMNLTGSGREGLNFENLGNFLIPVMGIEEQVEIGNRVSNLNSRFFKLNDKLTTMIDRLVEYRQSLISSVVTGKIQVTKDMI